MAIALDAHTAAGISAAANPLASPQTFSHTTGSGANRLLIVTIKMRGGAGGVVTGVTYNGVAMTQVTPEALTSTAHAVIYYLVNPASGANTVSISHNMTGSTSMVASATTLTGVDQANPLNASNKASATSAGPMTTSVTTTVADCWIIDACAMRTSASDTATMTAVTNRTQRTNALTAANGLRGLVSTLGPAGAAGSKTMEWTKTLNHDWAIMAAAFAPAGSGYTLTAAAGSYALTGTATGLRAGRRVVAGGGSYSLTGTAATMSAARRIVAAAGTYALTGTASITRVARRIVAAAGALALTGTPATLNYGALAKTLVAAAGSYVLAGASAALSRTWRLVAAPGNYILSGQAALLAYIASGGFRRDSEPAAVVLTPLAEPSPVTHAPALEPAAAGITVEAAPPVGAFVRVPEPPAVELEG